MASDLHEKIPKIIDELLKFYNKGKLKRLKQKIKIDDPYSSSFINYKPDYTIEINPTKYTEYFIVFEIISDQDEDKTAHDLFKILGKRNIRKAIFISTSPDKKKETEEFVKKWYEEHLNFQIKDQSENTLKLGKDKLSVLKEKLKELKEGSQLVTNERLSKEELWWHKDYQKDSSKYIWADDFKRKIEKEIRFILGRLHLLLKEFGYDRPGKYEQWIEWEKRGWSEEQSPFYPYHLELSSSIESTWEKYSTLLSTASELFSGILRLKKEQKESEAKELWDSS